MLKQRMHKTSTGADEPAKKGIALLIVIGTVLVVIILAGALLALITSHARVTSHQISRIQAYYAGLAGIYYAQEMLRNGGWDLASSCPPPGCDFWDTSFTPNISNPIKIAFKPNGFSGCNTPIGTQSCISVTVNYTTP